MRHMLILGGDTAGTIMANKLGHALDEREWRITVVDGNHAMHMPTVLGAMPRMSSFATSMMKKEMEKLDIPPVGEFLTMIHDVGGEIYACKTSVDMFHLKSNDFCQEVDGIISVGQFYEKAAGTQIIFT